jgi:hypothetical protein
MRRFELKFDCENAAFEGDPETEVARILRNIAEKVAMGFEQGAVYDINGNRVGDFWLLT